MHEDKRPKRHREKQGLWLVSYVDSILDWILASAMFWNVTNWLFNYEDEKQPLLGQAVLPPKEHDIRAKGSASSVKKRYSSINSIHFTPSCKHAVTELVTC